MSHTHYPDDDYRYEAPPAAHPIQSALMSFAGAYWIAALVTDLAYWQSANMMWANFSSWLLMAGLVFGGCGLLAALINIFRRHRLEPSRPVWLAFLICAVAWALSLVNAFVHSRDAWTSVVPTGLALSAVVTLLVLVLGWHGWWSAKPARLGRTV